MPRKKKPTRAGGGPTRSSIAFAPLLPAPVRAGIKQAEQLRNQGRGSEALALLERTNSDHPGHEPVLQMLLEGATALGDTRRLQIAAEGLAHLGPDDPNLAAGLAPVYLLNERPALAVQAMRSFLRRFPDHELAAGAQGDLEKLETALRGDLEQAGLDGENAVEDAALHEAVRSRMEQERFDEGRALAQELLARRPRFAPAGNNLAVAEHARGDTAAAIAAARGVLAFEPDNVHALSNLARFLFQAGQTGEARETADRLLASAAPATDRTLKVMEALSYLGDDAAVLEAFLADHELPPPLASLDEAEAEIKREDDALAPSEGIVFHLAGVAALRRDLGEKVARALFVRALRHDPTSESAQQNLFDLEQPAGERNGPWPFALNHWVTRQTVDDLKSHLLPATKKNSDENALTAAASGFLQSHPEIAALAPALLDRGDPSARQLAFNLARMAATPALLAALRDFALGTHGPDQMRIAAAQMAVEAGVLDGGNVRLFLAGEWQDLLLLGWEITDKNPNDFPHSPQVEQLLREATQAQRENDADRALPLLRQALESEPDAPDLWNNLAAALAQKGETAEYEAIIGRLHADHPDYLFGATNRALLFVRGGDTQAARALLDPLLRRRRLHPSELSALCSVQVELLLAEKNVQAAASWLEMWESGDPDNPALEQARLKVLLHDPETLKERFNALMKSGAPRKKRGGDGGGRRARQQEP